MKRKNMFRAIVATTAGGILAAGLMAAPASAAGELATANIGSSPGVTISNTWQDINGATRVVTVTSHFSNHTAGGATIDSFTLCYSGPANSTILVSPYTRNAEGNLWESGPYRQLTKGDGIPAPCTTYAVGQHYEAGSDDVVRVVSRVTSDGGNVELIAGYYR